MKEGQEVEGLTPTLCHDVALAFASVPRTTADDSLHAFLGPSNTSTVACFARALVLGSHRRINQPVWKLGGVVYFGEGVSMLASEAGGVSLVLVQPWPLHVLRHDSGQFSLRP